MKTFQFLGIGILLLCSGCNKSNDDDGQSEQQTNQQLLVSGKWYFESKSSGSFTGCEKKGYVQFSNNGNFTINVFDDSSGNCESLGVTSATYTLTDEVNLTLTSGSESQTAIINFISENQLNITNYTEGETIVFDKTEG